MPNGFPEVKLPVLLIGFKTYAEATGAAAVRLASVAGEIAARNGITIVPIGQYTDIHRIACLGVPVFAQHIDPVKPGSHTGHVLPEAVREAGAVGTLINHSERRLSPAEIEGCIERAREVDLLSCVCSDSPQMTAKIARFGPDLILVENPELIGTGRAVSSADPRILSESLDAVAEAGRRIPLVCGAGIGNHMDVERAISLGMSGVGAASAIIRSPEPGAVIDELSRALLSSWRGERIRLIPGSGPRSLS
jgi:triosephosphate isomerase